MLCLLLLIGRKSKYCFGFGICEWFPSPAGSQVKNYLSDSQLVLPVFEMEESGNIVIKSNISKERFFVEENLIIGNVTIPMGKYQFSEKVGGYILPILVD